MLHVQQREMVPRRAATYRRQTAGPSASYPERIAGNPEARIPRLVMWWAATASFVSHQASRRISLHLQPGCCAQNRESVDRRAERRANDERFRNEIDRVLSPELARHPQQRRETADRYHQMQTQLRRRDSTSHHG